MKLQVSAIALAVFAATQAQAVTATYGWEDGSTVLGQFSASHISHVNSLDQARTGNYSLLVEDVDPVDNSTPQSFLAWVNGLSDGDVVTVNMWVYDDSGDRPAGRVWGHYTDDATDVDSYAGSAGGNSAYTDGSGWQQLSHTWTFDSSSGTRDGLVVEFRLYDSSSFTTGGVFVDDIEVISSAGTVTLPSGEVVSDGGGDTGGGDTGGGDNGGSTGSEIYISEYVEGSSNNKAIELFNPTDQAIDLGSNNYVLARYSNGGTNPSNITLSGTVAAGGTFVVANSSAAAAILAVADQTTGSVSHNGDDAYVLTKGGTVIDSFGQVGTDPGSAWGTGDSSTANNTLRRTVSTGDTVIDDAFDPAAEWLGVGNDVFDDLGSHNGSTGGGDNGGGDNGGGDNGGSTDPVVCGDTFTTIHAIQGSGAASPLSGVVEVEGVVTGDFQSTVDGFYLQSAIGEEDADLSTSEGVFVYTGNAPQTVSVGDRVRVRATVAEFNDMTQLSNVTDLAICASGVAVPEATEIFMPFASADAPEALEGMLVSFNGLTVNDTFNLSRFGSATLSKGRRMNPTQVATPGAAADAVAAANALNAITLDDGSNAQNPDVVPYPAPGLSAANTLRVGDSVSVSSGVLHYAFGEYRVYPTTEVVVTQTNPRTVAPELSATGNLKVASFNVLNYFTTLNERGADTAEEFTRQKGKIVAALAALDADVVGLMEIENNGFGNDSAIADLVDALNQADPGAQWQYVIPGVSQIGTDQIMVGLIYRATVVAPAGLAQILDSANSITDESGDPLFIDNKNRPALAQKFALTENGETIVVAVNHLKSKGSNCDSIGDPDVGDGQGNCNVTRTKAAQAVSAWLNATYTDDAVLVIGDMNAYAKEDPITAFATNGYAELFSQMNKGNVYGYVFRGESGQLDHALANTAALDKIVDVAEWHINADEPRALDYNTEFKSAAQIDSFYAADAYRSSDHDPVVIALSLETPIDPNLTIIDVAEVENVSGVDELLFMARSQAWKAKVALWEAKVAQKQDRIAQLDPETKAERIANLEAQIEQLQARTAIYNDLIDTALMAVGAQTATAIDVERQINLSDKNQERALRRQARFEKRSGDERAIKLETRADELEAKGRTELAAFKREQAAYHRARAAVFAKLAEVMTASLAGE